MAQRFLAFITLLTRRYLFVISLVFLLVVIVILTYLMLFSRNVESENECECAATHQRTTGNQQSAKRADNVSQNQLSETLPVETPPAIPWSKYEISRTASFSFPYKDFRVLVYERGPVAVGTTKPSVYYFSPALILNTSSANTSFNWFEQRFVVTFSLIMYNKDYTDHIKAKILQIMNVQVKDQNLHVMPIEEMRLISSNPEWDSEIEVDTTWRSYSSQSDSSEFRIFCNNGFKCQRLKEGIEKKGSEFIGDIEVHYALESQRSAARRLTLTAEHIQTGKMFTELEQRYAGYDEVYLNGEDSKRMQQEIASNVMAAEIADSEYVSGEQSPTLLKFIEQALSLQEVSSAKFTPEMWKSVYWKDENSRPDKITREYQNSFDKQDRETQSRIMDYFKKAEKESWCAKTGGGVSEVASGNLKVCSDTSSSSAQRNEMENYLRNINEGRKATEMQGEKFVPKEMSLKRTNIAKLKQTSSLGTVSIKISKIIGVMKTNVNFLETVANSSQANTISTAPPAAEGASAGRKPLSDIREVFHVRVASSAITYRKEEAASICQSVFNSTLASLANMRDAWLDGADWCEVGHILEERTLAYPARDCLRPATSSYRGDICYKDVGQINSYVAAEFGLDYNMQLSGFNCFGIKPLSGGARIYGGYELLVLPFNQNRIGQYQHTIK